MTTVWLLILSISASANPRGRAWCEDALTSVRIAPLDQIEKFNASSPLGGPARHLLTHVLREIRKVVYDQDHPAPFFLTVEISADHAARPMAQFGQLAVLLNIAAFERPESGFTYAVGLQIAHEYFRRNSDAYRRLSEPRDHDPDPWTRARDDRADLCRHAYAATLANLVNGDEHVRAHVRRFTFRRDDALPDFTRAVVLGSRVGRAITRRKASRLALRTLIDLFDLGHAEVTGLDNAGLNDWLRQPVAEVRLIRAFAAAGAAVPELYVRRPGRVVATSSEAIHSAVRPPGVRRIWLETQVIKDARRRGPQAFTNEYALLVETKLGATVRLPLLKMAGDHRRVIDLEPVDWARALAQRYWIEGGQIKGDGSEAHFAGLDSDENPIFFRFAEGEVTAGYAFK